MYTIEQIKLTLPDIEAHPAADKLPLMPKEKFDSLKFDMITNGMLEPIWVAEGKILDGRSRYAALQWLKRNKQLFFEADIREWENSESDMDSVVRSLNVHRNNYTKQQLAVYAVRYLLPTLKEEARQRMYKQVPVELFPEVQKGNANYLAAIQAGTNEKYVQLAYKIQQCNDSFLDFVMNKQMTLQEGIYFIGRKMGMREQIFERMKRGMKFSQAIENTKAEMKPETTKCLHDNQVNNSKEEAIRTQVKSVLVVPVNGIVFKRAIPQNAFEEIQQILHKYGFTDDSYTVLDQEQSLIEKAGE